MAIFDSLEDLAASSSIETYLAQPENAEPSLALEILRCALLGAHEGGVMIREAIKNRPSSASSAADTKVSAADLVTETDIAVEKCIRNRIEKSFPDHLFVGEESSADTVTNAQRTGRYVWIVDPIDGTTNFVHAFPVVAVSIAVAFGEEAVLGVVYNPLADELWFAWKGCGAFMKKRDGSVVAIHTSRCEEVGSGIISTGFGIPLLRRKTTQALAQDKLLAIIEHNTRILMTRSRDIRRVGSAACDLCLVAMGLTDCYFEFGIKEWDIAAGIVILLEAGGACSTVGGLQPASLQGRNILAAASEELRAEMCGLLVDKDVVSIIEEIEK